MNVLHAISIDPCIASGEAVINTRRSADIGSAGKVSLMDNCEHDCLYVPRDLLVVFCADVFQVGLHAYTFSGTRTVAFVDFSTWKQSARNRDFCLSELSYHHFALDISSSHRSPIDTVLLDTT